MQMYNNDENVPLILRCGHTVCRACAKKMNNSILTGNAVDKRCPFDKSNIDFANPDFLSKNYSVLDLLESLKTKKLRPDEKLCDKHPKKKVKFYCQAHGVFVCSDCLADGEHLGHDIKPAGPFVLSYFVAKQVKDAKESLEHLESERIKMIESA